MNAVIIFAMNSQVLLQRAWAALCLAALLLTGACRSAPVNPTPLAAATITPTAAPSQTPTPFLPSPTPEPLAAVVNGEQVTMIQFQIELARYQAAVGTEVATGEQQRVLGELVDQILLAQAAAQAGYVLDENGLQSRLQTLTEQAGGQQALLDWLATNGYTLDTFQQDLTRAAAAAWKRDQIAAGVPQAVEQVHARWLRLSTAELAQQALQQVGAGASFADLAAQADPLTGGDLDWFPRGFLTDPALEEAAFSLQPGEVSQVIESSLGFVLLQTIERDPARQLSTDARLRLQAQAVADWLEQRRAEADIRLLLP